MREGRKGGKEGGKKARLEGKNKMKVGKEAKEGRSQERKERR